MRAFHMTWLAFFLCFFGWFGLAPLMPVIRQELHLTKAQIGNLTIASVAITVLVRLLIGWLCDKIGPRRAYTWLLILGSLPVMLVGLAHDYTTFLIFRVAIGAIGASFVITQYHTSVMFAPNIVGTANATAAGWGNLGGGVTQIVLPLLFAGFVSLGFSQAMGWRMAMFIPGALMFIAGIAYYKLTQDTADGNFEELRARGEMAKKSTAGGAFASAMRDPRVWALFVIYGACFGMELTIDNIAALYFTDNFNLQLTAAGLVAGSFGMMNLFARALGGIISDRFHQRWGLRGRALLLGATICAEGLALMLFSQMRVLPLAIAAMMLTGLFIKNVQRRPPIRWFLSSTKRLLGRSPESSALAVTSVPLPLAFCLKAACPGRRPCWCWARLFPSSSLLALTVRFSESEEKNRTTGDRRAAGWPTGRCRSHGRLTCATTSCLQSPPPAWCALKSPAPAEPMKIGNIVVTGSLRSRVYGWNWFEASTGRQFLRIFRQSAAS